MYASGNAQSMPLITADASLRNRRADALLFSLLNVSESVESLFGVRHELKSASGNAK